MACDPAHRPAVELGCRRSRLGCRPRPTPTRVRGAVLETINEVDESFPRHHRSPADGPPCRVTDPRGPSGQELVGEGACRAGEGAVAALGQRDGAAHRRTGERDAHQRAVAGQRDGRHDGGAETGGHEGEDARHLAALADEVRLDLRLQAGRQGDRPEVVALPEHHQVEAVEVTDPDPPAAGEGVVGRGGQHQWVVEERRRHHQRVGHRQHDEGQVDLARGDLGHQLVRACLHHRQVDAAVAGVELDERRGQHARDEAGRGADGEMAPGHARQGPGLGPGGLDVGHDALHERQQGAAVGGEGDPPLPRAPVEEDDAELVLEQADLTGERGLGQVQPGGRPGEALLLRHGQGVGQLVQLHVQSLSLLL